MLFTAHECVMETGDSNIALKMRSGAVTTSSELGGVARYLGKA